MLKLEPDEFVVEACDSYGYVIAERLEFHYTLFGACVKAHAHLRNRQPTFYRDQKNPGTRYRVAIVDAYAREFHGLKD